MELLLLKAVALFRPLASLDIGGHGILELLGAGLFLILAVSFLSNSALRQTMHISAIDLTVFAICAWVISGSAIYYETSRISDMSKLLIPLLSYTFSKNIIQNERQYRSVVGWMVVGFSIAAIASAVLILTGKGVGLVSYWTGVTRYEGAYSVTHNFGHSMTFLIFALVSYGWVVGSQTSPQEKAGNGMKWTLLLLAAVALYCLYMSQTRSAFAGLAVFALVYLAMVNFRLLVIGGVVFSAVAILTLPFWFAAWLPDIKLYQEGRIDAMDIGSSRPRYWAHNLEVFGGLPIDQKIAGLGVGSLGSTVDAGAAGSEVEVIDSHNDWLSLLMQTGLVGLLLFAILQVVILRAVLQLPHREKAFFLGILLAVNVMMLVSNSYALRIAVSQTYYILLSFIELRKRSEVSSRPVLSARRI